MNPLIPISDYASAAAPRNGALPGRHHDGQVALLPIYARDLLETGPFGLGVLRVAPAVGALLMTILLVRHAINRHLGMRKVERLE